MPPIECNAPSRLELADLDIYRKTADRLYHCAQVLTAGRDDEVARLSLREEPLRNDLYHAIDQAVTMLHMLRLEAMQRLGLDEDDDSPPF